jgi:MFS transporter, ACS family, allantoate permease
MGFQPISAEGSLLRYPVLSNLSRYDFYWATKRWFDCIWCVQSDCLPKKKKHLDRLLILILPSLLFIFSLLFAGPTIIAGFGFDTNRTTLLSMAPGACAVVGTLVALFVAKVTNRTITGIYTVLLGCIGVIMMLTIPSTHNTARYGGYILTLQCKFCLYLLLIVYNNKTLYSNLINLLILTRERSLFLTDPICVLSIIAFMTAGVGGTTKKLAFGAAYQLGYAVGNIIGPQTYRADDAPNYYVSFSD